MRSFFRHFRPFFAYAGIFSFFLNILMLALPIYTLQLFDRVLGSRSEETLVMLSIVIAGALLVIGLLEVLRSRLLLNVGILMDQHLGGRVLSGLMQHAARFEGRDHAQGMRDIAVVRGFLTGSSIFALFDVPWVPFYLMVIYLFHPLLGFLATLSALLLFGLAVWNEKSTRKSLEETSKAARKASRFIDASVRNAEVVAAMGLGHNIERRWSILNNRVLELQSLTSHQAALVISTTKFCRQFIQVLMLGTGAYLVIRQNVTPGVMMASTYILARALAPVESAITTWKQLVDSRMSYASLDQLLASKPLESQSVELPAPEGDLCVEKAAFVAPNSQTLVLKGVSFTLVAGESLGIIGPSAAGKSTLVRLLVGIWKPMSGSVRLDGVEVSNWPHLQLGKYVGYLPQDVELFAGTVGENIARMDEVQNCSEQIIDAAKLAGVHEMILKLPHGYETEIGEGGIALSVGQRQRIGLARAVFGEPRFVVLDEPNANLDSDGEDALQQVIGELKSRGVTLIIVSHRPSALVNIDKILVLREGAVELFGPRAEVLARLTRPTTVPMQPGGAASHAGA